ncbi:MAG: hypothetical protein LLG05_01080 [Porphyromonadaceae bacterium]|jgi:hypothetical protein|nr:hypothetical protein [Porphyromonadaceae bacterium]
MNKVDFESFVELKVRDIVAIVMERRNFDFEAAILYLYNSRLYDMLLDEESKLWHLSNEKLFEMLLEEKEHEQLVLPDYV